MPVHYMAGEADPPPRAPHPSLAVGLLLILRSHAS
jgi:hypothetical protein